jgi:hypothetical protein
MNASNDDHQDGCALLAAAATRACTFDFEGAQELCERLVALEAGGAGNNRYAPRARTLLKAIEHNRSSYLYGLMVKGTRPRAGALDLKRGRFFSLLSKDARRSTNPPGQFKVLFKRKGMVVSGSVSGTSPMVHVFINELLVASVRTAANRLDDLRGIRRFSFRINTSSLSLLPGREKARLALSTGDEMLRDAAGSAFYLCDWPEGKGGIEDAIMSGAILTAHRTINPPPSRPTVEGWLATYEKLAKFMQEQWGRPIFLYYGSLLGAVRDNAVIPHDDDFDVAYFSEKTSAVEIKQEMIEIIAALAASDASITVRLMTFFFKVEIDGGVIDVFPAWHDGHVLWSPWSTCLECNEDVLKQVTQRDFLGHRVFIPADAERFLALKYGEGWRAPDPGYQVKARPDIVYPFRKIAFDEADRSRIIKAAREIAGSDKIGAVELRPVGRSLKARFKTSPFGDLPRQIRGRLGLQALGRHS